MTEPAADLESVLDAALRGLRRPARSRLGALLDDHQTDSAEGLIAVREPLLAALRAAQAGEWTAGSPLLRLPAVVAQLGPEELSVVLAAEAPAMVAWGARLLLERTPPSRQGAALVSFLEPLAAFSPDLLFVDLLDLWPHAPPGWERLGLRLKIALLPIEAEGAWSRLRLRLLLGLPRSPEERALLERNARGGSPDALHGLLDAAFAEGDPRSAALEAISIQAFAKRPSDRARVLERGWRMALRGGDPNLALRHAEAAFLLGPDLASVLRLAACSPAVLPPARGSMVAAAFGRCLDHAYGGADPQLARVQLLLELLSGQLELVVARLQSAPALDVLAAGHPASLAIPCLIALGTGGRPGPLGRSLLARLDNLSSPTERRRPEGSLNPPSLRETLSILARDPAIASEAPWCRAVVRAEALRALDEAARRKEGYEVVTLWVRAVAEGIAVVEGEAAGEGFRQEAGRRHPRHKALHRMIFRDWSEDAAP